MKTEWFTFALLLELFLHVLANKSPALQPCSNTDYRAQRNCILAKQSHSSLGGKLLLRGKELMANDILMAAKDKEISQGFKNPHKFLPAHNFLVVAQDIRLSPTFQIIRKMPKGAVLHAHNAALVSAEFVYENITFRENLYICRPKDESMSFRFLRSAKSNTTCTSPMGWELLADRRANATIAEDVNTLIRNSLTMIVPDPAAAYPDADVIWGTFGKIFDKLKWLLNYLPVYSDYYYQALTELREDNVLYLEVRSRFPTLYDLDGNTYGPVDAARIYKTVTDRFVKDYPDFIGAKVIFSPSNKASPTQIKEYVRLVTTLKKKFPDFVIGFDLTGQEDRGNPLIEFADELKTISPDIQLFFHAGETTWNGLSSNILDAVTPQLDENRPRIIRKMPKGAVLHTHYNTIVTREYIYYNITFRENLYICRLENGSISFRFLRSADNDTACTSPMGWELLTDLRANATVAKDVNTQICKALTIIVPDPATAYPNIDSVWSVFRQATRTVKPLLTYLPVFSDYCYQTLADLYEDNVLYAELRTDFQNFYDLDGNIYGLFDVVRFYKNITDRFTNDHPEFIGTKQIYARSRSESSHDLDTYLHIAAALKKEYPEFVAGFDLVGQEDRGNRYFIPEKTLMSTS